MKAVIFKTPGPADVLQTVEDFPKPVLSKPRDLLIKVVAFATNPVDTKKRNGFYVPKDNTEDVILGFDGAGVVEAIGTEATLFKVGDEVYFAGDIGRQGSYAEYVLIDERIVGHKPKSISFEQAAALPLTVLTFMEAFTENFKIQPKKRLLITAGAGGAGSIAIQLAKKVLDLHVIATASRPETRDYCLKLGADEIIDHSKGIASQLPEGVDYIYNCAPPDQIIDELMAVLKPFGYISSILGGSQPYKPQSLFMKRGTINYEFMFARTMHGVDLEKQGEILNYVSKLVDDKQIISTCTEIFNWKSIKEVHTKLESGKTIGKIVLNFQ